MPSGRLQGQLYLSNRSYVEYNYKLQVSKRLPESRHIPSGKPEENGK
jgi:hypothetical protein